MSPYIPEKRRDELSLGIDTYSKTPGELNYEITEKILDYLHNKKVLVDVKMFNNYADYNEVMGVLECVKQELYRRLIAPYEQGKCKLNGDVYEQD